MNRDRRTLRFLTTGLLALTMAVMLTANVLREPSASAGDPATAGQQYDGETLLRGMFFGIGPVAADPSLVLFEVEDNAANLGLIADLIGAAGRIQPAFLNELLQTALQSLDPGGSGAQGVGAQAVWIAVAAVVFVVAVVTVAIVEIAIAAVVPVSSVAESQLKFERWVDAVATRLG